MAAEALLLDLDGTVWDSQPWYATLVAAGDEGATQRALADLRGGLSAATLLKRSRITPARFRRLCNAAVKPGLYEEVHRTLEALRRLERPTGAVTNLPAWMAEPMLECLELDGLLDTLVPWRPGGRAKPRPESLLIACRDLGIEPTPRTWYVGDMTTDGRAARAAGLSFAWVSYGYEPSAPPGCDAELERFEQILEL